MSLYEYTEEQQLTIVKSVSMLYHVYQLGDTLYWKQDYLLEGPESYISIDLNWMYVQFNQVLPEGATEYSFGVSCNLQSMVIMRLAATHGWEKYPIKDSDIKNIIAKLIQQVDFLGKEDPDVMMEELKLGNLVDEYHYYPVEYAIPKVAAKVKAKVIAGLKEAMEKAIKDAEI